MRLFRVVGLLLVGISTLQFTEAQLQPPVVVPQGIDALRQMASSKTEFTLDHSMLVFASKLDPGDEDLRRVIAGISGISVHSFRFSRPWVYDPAVVNSVKDEYHTGGWKQLVNNHDSGDPGMTDVWVRLENNAVSNVAMLFARANEVDYILVSGSISPMDLSHLGGHFGIPKIEGGVMVPNERK
ncbi:MAG: DUF4252 domain-containing protein [Terriglobales bacterium]